MIVQSIDNPTQSQRFALIRFLAVMIAAAILVAPGALFAAGQTDANLKPSPVSVDVQVDKSEAQIAERIQLVITATVPQGVSVQFPELEKQLGKFEVVNVKDTLDIPTGSNRKSIRHVGLESLNAGELEIPAIEISYVDRRGSSPVTGLQKTLAQQVTIRSTLEGVEDPTQFRDIKSVVFLPESKQRDSHWIGWAAGAAGLLLIATVALVLARRKNDPSPKQWAIKSLVELRDGRAFQNQDAEQIYIRLASILRSFVREQFEISAPRLTTADFLETMQSDRRLSAEFRSELSELLSLADLVKFAGMLPDGGQLSAVIDQSIQLVENAADVESQALTISDADADASARSGELPSTAEDN